MSKIDTDEMRAVIEDKRDLIGDSPMLNRIEEMVDEIELLREGLSPVDCPVCDGEGGSVGYYGEWSECIDCDGEGDVSPCEAVRIEERLRARNEYFGLLGHKEDAERKLERQRDTLAQIRDITDPETETAQPPMAAIRDVLGDIDE